MSENIQVPKGWEVKKLGEVGLFLKGKGIKKDELVTQGLPCIIYGQIYTTYDYYTHNLISFIPEYLKHSTTEIFKNDILFAGSGETKEEIGKSITYLGNTPAYAGGDIIILRQNVLISKYITFYLNSIGRKQLNKLGQGDSVVHIYKSSLEKINIPVPPLEEQKKIAEILSLWDKAIEQTKELIAYKEKQKKGLMQALLTGKKRLNCFTDEWKTTKLGEIFDIQMCKRIYKEQTNDKSGIPFYKIGTIGKEADAFIDEKLFSIYKNKYNYPLIGETLITCSGTIGKCYQYNGEKAYFQDSNIVWLRAKNQTKIDLNYIFIIVSNIKWNSLEKTTITRLYTPTLKKAYIFLPPFDEQKAIADILSSADEEINLLNEQLELYTEQKKGLMQNLLTGKVRV